MDLDFLEMVSRYFVYLAILGWAMTFIGFAATVGRGLIRLKSAAR
jgi:hypothetical protein